MSLITEMYQDGCEDGKLEMVNNIIDSISKLEAPSDVIKRSSIIQELQSIKDNIKYNHNLK